MAYVHDDDDESELDDREFPDEADDAVDTSAAEPCPFCNKPIYEHADICPHCRNCVSIEGVQSSRPWWYWAGLIAAFTVTAMWVLFG